MSNIRFTKMSGSGNDFIFIDNRSGIVNESSVSDLATTLCQHRLSVGADGIVLISENTDGSADYDWRYINADGSDGEMCGNASMCSARFAAREQIAPLHHTFRTASGTVEAWANDGARNVTIAMPDTGPVQASVSLTVAGLNLIATPIQVGVPHVVIRVPDADAFADGATFASIGQQIRLDAAFAPAGTNVNFVSARSDGSWRMRTYERGVERETLACGTGVVATSVVLACAGLAQSPVQVTVSSGNVLSAEFALTDSGAASVRLSGFATFVFDGELDPEALS